MLALVPHAEGTVLLVRAHAGARRNQIGGVQDGQLKVSVTAAAEKGKANQAIVALLARELSLKRSQIELLAGAASPQKRFLVRGVESKELAVRTAAAIDRSR
ncbi:MAG TPA: DUF167 domain-containing protein [Pirellulales bacterium]|jgi:hypothetical protein|nr:DUF167 domain-containing protein [Pirellulales bacterium]